MSRRQVLAPRNTISRVRTDGVALMASTAGAAASSLLFWVVAARRYPTEAVGQAAAEIAAFTMLAGFAQLNLLSVFLRFLASAGNRVVRFLSAGYLAILVTSLVAGAAFLLLGLGSEFLAGAGPTEFLVFVFAVAVFALFVVQDGVLTAFGKAPWVPVENLAVALARLALLALLVPALLPGDDGSRVGIVSAWFGPALVAVAVVSVVILRRLAPREVRRSPDRSQLPGRRDLASFVFAEYLNNLVSNVVTFVPPLLVLHLLDATAAAYFNVPWLIVVTTQTLLWNIGMSLVAEATRRPEQLRTHVRHTVRLGIVVVAGWTAALLLAAPLLLGLQGADFASEGTALLRVLALSLPCTAVVIMYSLVAILERRLWRLVAVNTVGAAGLLLATTYFAAGRGIWSIGVIYLAIQAGMAAILLFPLIRRLRNGTITLPELVPDRGDAPAAGAVVEPVISPSTRGDGANQRKNA